MGCNGPKRRASWRSRPFNWKALSMLSSGREGGVWKPVRELHYRIAAALRADDGRESPMHPCAQTGSLSHLSSSDRTNLPMGDRRLWGVVT